MKVPFNLLCIKLIIQLYNLRVRFYYLKLYSLAVTFFCVLRTKILAVDLTSKQEQIKHLEQQKEDLENELQRKQDQVATVQLKFSDLVKSFSKLHQDLKTQRASLCSMKVIVQENNQTALEHLQYAVTNVEALNNKFSTEKNSLENKFTKVGAHSFDLYMYVNHMYTIILCCYFIHCKLM